MVASGISSVPGIVQYTPAASAHHSVARVPKPSARPIQYPANPPTGKPNTSPTGPKVAKSTRSMIRPAKIGPNARFMRCGSVWSSGGSAEAANRLTSPSRAPGCWSAGCASWEQRIVFMRSDKPERTRAIRSSGMKFHPSGVNTKTTHSTMSAVPPIQMVSARCLLILLFSVVVWMQGLIVLMVLKSSGRLCAIRPITSQNIPGFSRRFNSNMNVKSAATIAFWHAWMRVCFAGALLRRGGWGQAGVHLLNSSPGSSPTAKAVELVSVYVPRVKASVLALNMAGWVILC